jgi:CRP-like cAMP-binding protein
MAGNAATFDELLVKLRRLMPLSEPDAAAVLAWPTAVRRVSADEILVEEGSRVDGCLVLLSGIAARAKLTSDGRRQIVSFHFPGDLLDPQHLFLVRADHSVQAITTGSVALVPREAITQTLQARPSLAEALWRHTLVDASVAREWLLNIGRRNARARISHLLCEVCVRITSCQIGEHEAFHFPVTQEHIADATGLTPVHVNRVLRALKEDGVLDYRGGNIRVKDWDRLGGIAEFNPAYLHQSA